MKARKRALTVDQKTIHGRESRRNSTQKTKQRARPETPANKTNLSGDTSKAVLAELNRYTMPCPGAVEPMYFNRQEGTTFLDRFEELVVDF